MSCDINKLMRLITDVRIHYWKELSNECIESLIKTDNLLFDFKMKEWIRDNVNKGGE